MQTYVVFEPSPTLSALVGTLDLCRYDGLFYNILPTFLYYIVVKDAQLHLQDDLSTLIRQALAASIEVLGERGSRALIEDLQRHGIFMDNLALEKLMMGLRDVLGDEAAEIIMQEVLVRLDKMYSFRT